MATSAALTHTTEKCPSTSSGEPKLKQALIVRISISLWKLIGNLVTQQMRRHHIISLVTLDVLYSHIRRESSTPIKRHLINHPKLWEERCTKQWAMNINMSSINNREGSFQRRSKVLFNLSKIVQTGLEVFLQQNININLTKIPQISKQRVRKSSHLLPGSLRPREGGKRKERRRSSVLFNIFLNPKLDIHNKGTGAKTISSKMSLQSLWTYQSSAKRCRCFRTCPPQWAVLTIWTSTPKTWSRWPPQSPTQTIHHRMIKHRRLEITRPS